MPRQTSKYMWEKIIFELRSERYLECTQESLARKLRVSVFTISKWERGTIPAAQFRPRIRKLAEDAGYSESTWPTVSQKIGIVKR